MDKKTLPLIILLIVVIVAYYPILEFLGFYTPEEPEPQIAADSSAVIAGDIIASEPPPQTGALELAEPVVADIDSLAVQLAPGDSVAISTIPDTIQVVTGKYRLLLSSVGGGPVATILNEYTLRDGTPIEMMPEATEASPRADFAGGTFSTSKIAFQCNLSPDDYEVTSQPLEVTYTYVAPQGGQIIRTFTFYPDSYHYDLVFRVDAPERMGLERKYNLIWGTPLGVTEPNPKQDYEAMQAVAMMSGSREALNDFEDDRLNQSLTGYTSWAGVREKYFAAVMIPRNREADGVFAQGYQEEVPWEGSTVDRKAITVGLEMPFAAVNAFVDSFTVFVGPLDYNLLEEYEVALEDMLDIGTTPVIGWLIKPFALGIIWLMPRMYDFIPNYGFVIILFALLVKIITLPLSMKSFKSMQAMRELSPKVEQLKERYKKDPQALNRETMKLYKQSGVSPMSGCLPIIPQMPLFFALFSVFRSTILLRDAPFIGFITDLSRGATGMTDPYIVLVVIMVVAQFLSQKVTMPSQGQNKALTYMMPLVFGFIFYSFPAGLVLYWICFSLFSMLDYVLFKRDKNKAAAVVVTS